MSLVGRTIGRYRITHQLGEGGMGVVYRAQDATLGRDVAIKVLRPELGRHPERMRRFSQEARAASALNHPNIITVHDAGEFEDGPFLVMELVEGESLRALLQRGPLPLAKVLDVGIQAATALTRAHESGITHRDLKPENLLLRPDGYVKILDFGLAKLKEKEPPAENASAATTLDAGLTSEGSIVGTAAYMSPEQATGRLVDGRSDIFSLALVLYECWQGRHPFLRENMLDTLHSIAHDRLPALAYPAGSPEWGLARILEKALEKEPDQRYQTIKDLGIDLRRLKQESESGKLPSSAVAVPAPRRRASTYVGIAALAIAAAAASLLWTRSGGKPAARSEWVQLTHFPDSVSQPTLSPDGRMLTFIRGAGSFTTSGQVYVKMLPDGEPKQLTQDNLSKMSPVFSPDGGRIAYTAVDSQNNWDTWVVPVLGGEPRRWLPNASGLMWVDRQKVLFSEIISKLQGNHMKIVAAEESRAGARDLYVPMPSGAMAHRSYPSPDAKWVLVAEMTDRGVWTPCRLVPMDASSPGHQVGPPGAACWFAGWSPDGKWMYVSSSAGGAFHIWRQHFPDGAPEQITSGPTEEQGLTMAPDGRSFITAVGSTQSSVWVHDGGGDRQVSLEGYAYEPKFIPGSKKLLYAVVHTASPERNELWVAELDSGRSEPLLPGFLVGGALGPAYDISPDGRRVVMEAADREGKSRLWLAPLDRRSPPQPIPNVEGDSPVFGASGEIFFRAREGAYGFAYRVREDGTGLQKAIEHPVIHTESVSPDSKWLVVYSRPSEEQTGGILAFPLSGGPSVRIYGPGLRVKWSPDGKLLFLLLSKSSAYSGRAGNTYVVPLPPGRTLPEIPPGGFQSEAEIAALPGVRVIGASGLAPGPTPDVYAFSRETVQRNLYRIPVP